MDDYLDGLRKQVKKLLSHDRYQHTLGVMYTAASLAMAHGADINDAMTAGVLHDCAKCYDDGEMLSMCEKYEVTLSAYEEQNHALIHAKLGAVLAEKLYGIENEEILNAIRRHTTGDEDMTLLDKVIYVADYIEPNRVKLPGLDGIRRIAFKDLDRAIYLIMDAGMEHLKNNGKVIDPKTEAAYKVFCMRLRARNRGRSSKVLGS